MSQESEIKKLSCYAVLRTGLSGETYLLSHMRLVLLLIYKKKYRSIDPKILISDFYDEYHYKIDYFPMLKILSLATEKGYLKKDHNSKKYVYTNSIEQFKDVENDIRASEKNHQRLMQSFIEFCKKRNVTYTLDNAKNIFISYINTQKLAHISGHIPDSTEDKRVDYLFGQFVFDLKSNNLILFDYLNSMVIGAVLADCLVFYELLENGSPLNRLTVVLDTTPVFISLGIDVVNRKEYYENLLSTLKHKGAKLAMFEHSYNEMLYILEGSKTWVESYDYDPIKASAATEYFRDIGASKEDVEELSVSLRQRISDLGIEIIDPSYDPKNHPYQIDEEKLTNMIIEQYQKTNKFFDLDAQKRSIDLDVKSIALLYFLRKKQKPIHIQDAKYIFITANRTLEKVAKEFDKTYEDGSKSIPPTLTDVFLGTYLWLSDPIKIAQMNEQQIMTQAYLAFQPNDELLEKLSNSANSLLESGEISSETCYMMRSSRLVSEKLAEKTLGNPEAYTEMTPLEILHEIQDDAAQKARNDMTAQLEQKVKEHNEEKRQIEENHNKDISQMSNTIHMLSQNLINEKKDKLEQLKEKKAIGTKTKNRWNTFIIILFIIFGLLIIAAIVTYIIWKEQDWYSPFITLLLTLIPVLGYISTIVYNLINRENPFNLQKSIQTFITKREEKKLKKLHYSTEDEVNLENEIKDLQAIVKRDFSK